MTAPRRVVVRGPNWLGDLVMAAPAIRGIGDAWPDAVVDVAVPAAFAPIVALLDPRTHGGGAGGPHGPARGATACRAVAGG